MKNTGLLVIMLLVIACGGSNFGVNPPPPDPVKAQELISKAWTEFENDRFQNAISLFNQAKGIDNAITDIFSGLGWSYFQSHDLNNSLFNFASAIGADSSFTDAFVGNSIAAFEKNEYELAINSITSITQQDSSQFDLQGANEYIFSHDTNVTSQQVRKILALSFYYSGDFDMALNQLNDFFSPINDLEPDSETFLIDLLTALEKL